MPVFLIIVGLYFLTAGVRGEEMQLAGLLHGDLTGQHSFIPWVVAILIVGAVGYVDELRPVSDGFMALLVVVLLLANKGFFAQFFSALGIEPQGVNQ